MSKEINDVDKEIKKVINKNKRELNTALIKPIHPNHKFSSNGLYMMIGKPGSGKTYYILKHIFPMSALCYQLVYGRNQFS